MIHEISPHIFHNQFRADPELREDSPVFVFAGKNEPAFGGGAVLIHDHHIPAFKDFNGSLSESDLEYLFSIDGKTCFLLRDRSKYSLSEDEGFVFKKIRDIRQVQEIEVYEYFLSMTALQLHNWYENNIYCGHCGTKLEKSKKERALCCPECGHTEYPRIVPAVTVAVIDRERNKILLTKYAGRDIPFYALVAGFTEIGETLEQTVEREVMEETGLRVKNIHYFGSQPWGIVDDLMVGFYCDLDGDNTIHRDKEELKLADWFSREETELQPTDLSLTNALMRAFKEGRI